ncbi:MAG: orotate phosphoribosyltransferase, partial [Rhodospirillaceae bacterium]|nr:orotate phosphoribosyltransferase [Rhodospirillaceae bacterium]
MTSRTPRQQAAARTIANILLETKAVNFRPEEPYTLTAGWASPVYIDCRWLISFPRARRTITLLAREEIEQTIGYEHLDAVAGGETAGIPYAAWISDALMLPMQYVRKKPKGFGRMAQIEGNLEEGSNVLLVEDLATDGGSKLAFVKALRDAGAKCSHTFVV